MLFLLSAILNGFDSSTEHTTDASGIHLLIIIFADNGGSSSAPILLHVYIYILQAVFQQQDSIEILVVSLDTQLPL